MKKFLVIGNPIGHSLSPEIHNYWLKKNDIVGIYEKKELKSDGLRDLILKVRKDEIDGLNVTVPFKKEIIPFLDELSLEAEQTQSVNTICLENGKIKGHNTDVGGFELAIKDVKYEVAEKKILIIGAGGVVPSIITALNKMKAARIMLCNRTKNKAEKLKNIFSDLEIVEWGEVPDFNMVINATSSGLKIDDNLNLDFSKIEKGNFFYDVIYNPKETNFLKKGKKLGGKTENGKKMFIYQAALAFNIWHGVYPKIDNNVNELLDK